MNRITLSRIMDRDAVDSHLTALKAAFAGGGTIEIDGSRVEQIGLVGLQLLASAMRTGQQRHTDVHITGVSVPMDAAITLAGMHAILSRETIVDDRAVA